MSGTQFLRSHFTGPSADSESTFLSTISLQLRRVRLISLLQLLAIRLEDTLGTLCVIVVVDQIEALHALALANARELLAAMNLSQVCHSALVKTAQTGALCGASHVQALSSLMRAESLSPKMVSDVFVMTSAQARSATCSLSQRVMLEI